MGHIKIFILLFLCIGISNATILSYAKDKNVFDIDKATIQKLYEEKNIKANSVEEKVLKLLNDRLFKLRKTNLSNLDTTHLQKIKEINNQIVVVGYAYRLASFMLYFDKNTLELTKITYIRKFHAMDITSDVTKLLVENYGTKEFGIYNIQTNTFHKVGERKITYGDIYFSPNDQMIIYNSYDKNNNELKQVIIYDTNTTQITLTTKQFLSSSIYIFFSPNNKYMVIYSNYKSNHVNYTLYEIGDTIKKTSSNKFFNTSPVILLDEFIIFNNKLHKLNNLKAISKTKHKPMFRNYIFDERNKNIFYTYDYKNVYIYAIENNDLYLIKTVSKAYTNTLLEVLNFDNKLLFWNLFNKPQIVDIPKIDIKNYNFALSKQLTKAKTFYESDFKDKALSMYEKASYEKEFFSLVKNQNLGTIQHYIDILNYKRTKDTKALATYILDALQYNYINEATKALQKLKKSNKKELYNVLNAIYMAQIGKEKIAYNTLVEVIPLSSDIQKLISKYSQSSLKIFKNPKKSSLIFDIDKNKIKYSKQKKDKEFISFNGKVITQQTKQTVSEPTKTDNTKEKIELLD